MPQQRSRLHVPRAMTLHRLNVQRFIRHCINGAFALNTKATIILIAAYLAFPWAIAQNDNKNLPEEAIETSDLGALQRTQALARTRIAQERKSALASFAADEVACYQKFQVNSCLVDARSRRSAALWELNRQEVALNDAQRQRAGAEKLERLADKKASQNPQNLPTPPTPPTPPAPQAADAIAQAPSNSATGQIPPNAQPNALPNGRLSPAEVPNLAPTASANPLQAQAQSAAQAAKSRQTQANAKAAAASKAAAKANVRAARLAEAAGSKARFEARVKLAQVRSAEALQRQQKAKKDVAPLPLPLPAPLEVPSSAPK